MKCSTEHFMCNIVRFNSDKMLRSVMYCTLVFKEHTIFHASIRHTVSICYFALLQIHSLSSITCSAHTTVDNDHSQSDLLQVHFIPYELTSPLVHYVALST